MMNGLVSRYSSALLELAKEYNCVAAWQKQCKLIVSVWDDECASFFNSPSIDDSVKKKCLEASFSQSCDELLLNFMFILVDRKRITLLKEISSYYITYANQELRIMNGIVYSSTYLNADELGKIEKNLSKKKHNSVELSNYLDKRLLSGVKVVVDGETWDSSLKGRLDELSKTLLKDKRRRHVIKGR